ncbi:MAG: BTAD domain-containing putative transcriptional regulator [Ilumatobacteraceae bacterium]
MRYLVLGPVEAIDDELAVVAVGGPQQRRLLALLVSRGGQTVSTERLVDCLWPDGLAPDGAARSVMTYVSRLRAALGESSISAAQGYRLELDGSAIDAQQFESLLSEAGTADPARAVELYDRALGLWRGTAYGDFGAEWWLLTEANRLDEMRVVAIEERAEAILALGHHHRAVPELEQLVGDHPLRERPVSLLMRALFATGRHADAFRVFQSFRTRLADETGLDPSDDLVALERSLASGQPVANVGGRAKLLRGYSVHEVLGEGAFGRVYAATQPGTNREVAIKAIRPDVANRSEFIQRFEAEAQLVARLEHPHIVPLYDYWREPGGAYLVFRLLLGGTALGAMVGDGPFSVARVSRLVEEVGSALLAAHTAGVVHCDIKPSNILFDETGNSYLSDFGIAVTSSIHEQAGDRTRVYAAPELIDRSGDTVQSDIFSFGCMMWELLAGESPLAVMRAASYPRLPSLAGILDQPCETLDAVLAKATSADPGSRFESMAGVIIAWRDAVGRPEGVLSPVYGRFVNELDSSRRRAVKELSIAISSAVNPYKGLRAFGEADAADFYGRDDVATALRDMLIAQSFVAVVGPSGSGKSSLVHAGLIPRLRGEGARVAVMVPGDLPTSALRDALSQIAATDIGAEDPDEMVKQAVADGVGNVVIVVDQFEECWTLTELAERERFLGAIIAAARFGVRCVTTIRADLYDRPLQHALIGRLIADGTFAVPPLSPPALEEAIVRPAEACGVSFDEGVVSAIVAEASAQPAGLPLLQFAMAELYERRVGNRVTVATLQQLGGLGGAIGRRAEQIYASLDDDMQARTRQLFGRLVAPGQGSVDTRRRARFSELSEADIVVADRFVQARLVVADRDHATREPVIEVAHEALLANWVRLREWLETDRRWFAQLHHLAMATRTWEEAGKADGELYRGARLEAVTEVLPERESQLSTSEHEFVAASRTARDAGKHRERRNARRVRRLLITTASFLVLALIVGAIAFSQRQQARSSQRDAEIGTLVGTSLAVRASRRDTAALLAIEAYRLENNPRTRSALLSTFTDDTGYTGTDRLPPSVIHPQGIILPDGQTALVMGDDNRFRSFDLGTSAVGEAWASLRDWDPPGRSHFVSSADGRLVAQIHWEEQFTSVLGVFDTTTHQVVVGPIDAPFPVDNAVFSPDDAVLYASGSEDGTVVAYSTVDGSELGRLPGLAPPDSQLRVTTAGLAFVKGGLLAVGSAAGPVRLVDPTTFDVRATFDAPPHTTERFLAIDGGKSLIGSGAIGRVRLDLAEGSRGPRWTVGLSDNVTYKCEGFAVSEKLGRFYCADVFGRLEERDVATGAFLRQLSSQNGATGSLWLADDQRELVSFGDSAPLVSHWRLDGSGPISRRIGDGAAPYEYSPDGRLLIADLGLKKQFFDRGGWTILDAETGNSVVDSTGIVTFPDWLTSSTLIGQAGGDTTGFMTMDVTTGDVHRSSVTMPRPPDSVFVSQHRLWLYYASSDVPGGDTTPDPHSCKALQCARPGEVWTIDLDSDTRIEPTIPTNGVFGLSGTDKGDRVVLASFFGGTVVDGTTGKTLYVLNEPYAEGGFVIPGNRVVTTTVSGELVVYDLDTFETLATLGGIRGEVGNIQGTSDGSLVAVTGKDRRVLLYDVASGKAIGDPITIPDTEAPQSALRPDGKELAVGGGKNSPFTIWDLDPGHWVTAACKIAGRNLTQQEWDTNIGDLAPYHLTCPAFA